MEEITRSPWESRLQHLVRPARHLLSGQVFTMQVLLNLVLLLTLSITTWALHESDVGIVDWHKLLIGIPLSGSVMTAPVFHHVGNKTIVLTATGNNVLAALEPEDGSVGM